MPRPPRHYRLGREHEGQNEARRQNESLMGPTSTGRSAPRPRPLGLASCVCTHDDEDDNDDGGDDDDDDEDG